MSDVEEPTVEETTYDEEVEEVEEEPEFVGDAGGAEIKLFGKWSFDEIEVRDISLEVRCGGGENVKPIFSCRRYIIDQGLKDYQSGVASDITPGLF